MILIMSFIRSSIFALSLLIASVLVLTVLFFATDPQSARLLGVLVVIVALDGSFLGAFLLIGNFIIRGKRKRHPIGASSRESGSQQLEISAVLALAPVLAIILNSLGAIGVVEIILVVSFEVVVIFLIRKKQ
jgi:hypothetical protein